MSVLQVCRCPSRCVIFCLAKHVGEDKTYTTLHLPGPLLLGLPLLNRVPFSIHPSRVGIFLKICIKMPHKLAGRPICYFLIDFLIEVAYIQKNA